MNQLPPMPKPRPWWRRTDFFLVLLVVVVAALVLRLYGGVSPAAPEILAAPYAEDAVQMGEPPLCRQVTDDMPESGPPVRFLMLNAENYFVAGEKQRSRYINRPKPEAECEAVAEVIASEKPAIVGLIEIGGPLALDDLKRRLRDRGLDYPHCRVLARGGEDRALALLSRYPVVQDKSRANYGLFGEQKRQMLRGILDVTVRVEDGRMFRVLGVHLKSRVSEDSAATASLRTREARTLARYIQQEMKEQPGLPMVVYGDFNDGPQDAAVRLLVQGMTGESALKRLSPKDSRNEEWTLYYQRGRAYNTFDHILVNAPMKKRMKRGAASGIVDIPSSRKASDHRAIWCDLR
ncbi:MAG: hypothetical protein IJ498_00275 [Akkermansia sp.]|nr:hypothetical protein [Akkermansia sp.]